MVEIFGSNVLLLTLAHFCCSIINGIVIRRLVVDKFV